MSREVLAIDIAAAVVLAVLVLIVSPGVAVSGMIALAVLLVCVISAVWARRGARRTGRAARPRRRR